MSQRGDVHARRAELEMASSITRVRVALVLLGILYAWTAYDNYVHLRPWRDGSMFVQEPTGEIKALVERAFCIVVFTAMAGVANVVLAVIAGKRTTFAIGAAIGIFAVYTALRLYQTDGRALSSWRWWVTAIVLGLGVQAAYRANHLRRSRQLATARVV